MLQTSIEPDRKRQPLRANDAAVIAFAESSLRCTVIFHPVLRALGRSPLTLRLFSQILRRIG